MNVNLNLGCSNFKINGLTNIDIDHSVNPDLILDLNNLNKHFQPNSVDFINAGHVVEHFTRPEALHILSSCREILKPLRNIIVVVPDYTKCQDLPVDAAERIILAGNQHKQLCNSSRIFTLLKLAGFHHVFEIHDLKEVPFIVVPDTRNPNPEPWQTAFLAFKLY